MATLAELVEAFANEDRPVGNLLDGDSLTAQAVAATRFYGGYAVLRSVVGGALFNQADPVRIDKDTVVNTSEWALIRPLFLLYVERETALQLEASRGLGVDPFGRSSSEVAQDITVAEADMPLRAFSQPIITV